MNASGGERLGQCVGHRAGDDEREQPGQRHQPEDRDQVGMVHQVGLVQVVLQIVLKCRLESLQRGFRLPLGIEQRAVVGGRRPWCELAHQRGVACHRRL